MNEGYYILLDLRGRRCVVVGGGTLATRKVEALCRCGAEVHIVSMQLCDTLAIRTDVIFHEKDYETADISGAVLVFACTDSREVNRQVSEDCTKLGPLCNAVDDQELCHFTVPAVLKRGPIQVAVGTAGASPYLAGRIRDLIGGWLDRAYEPFARKLSQLRPMIVDKVEQQDRRKAIFQKLAGRESFDRFKREGTEAWCEWIEKSTDGKVSTKEATYCTTRIDSQDQPKPHTKKQP